MSLKAKLSTTELCQKNEILKLKELLKDQINKNLEIEKQLEARDNKLNLVLNDVELQG